MGTRCYFLRGSLGSALAITARLRSSAPPGRAWDVDIGSECTGRLFLESYVCSSSTPSGSPLPASPEAPKPAATAGPNWLST